MTSAPGDRARRSAPSARVAPRRFRIRARRRAAALAAATAGLLVVACGSPASSALGASTVSTSATSARAAATASRTTVAAATTSTPSVWPGYHLTAGRTGSVASGPSLDPLRSAWTAKLGGAVFGQPVVADGRVVAATETNRVVALRPSNGTVLWSRTLGTPLTNVDAVAGCGDIDPLGVTSTPVIDPATNTVYVVAEISDGGGAVHHQLFGIALANGAIRLSEDVDPPLPAGEVRVTLLQRASLALGNGRVYIGYGGNSGDCGHYHGWVVGVNEKGAPHEVSFEVASDGEGGAVWQGGGAPALDARGNVYVTTGNANPDPPQGGPDPKKYTESVVKLSPTLHPLASFKDRTAGADEDLSTGNPVVLSNGYVFAVGKTDIAYVLRSSNLSKVAAIRGVCGSNPDGGPAYDRATNTMVVPCRAGGSQEVNLTTHKLGRRIAGPNGSPLLIGSNVWTVQYPGGTLNEHSATTGARRQSVSLGTTVPHFTSPSLALGLLLIGTDQGVRAFK